MLLYGGLGLLMLCLVPLLRDVWKRLTYSRQSATARTTPEAMASAARRQREAELDGEVRRGLKLMFCMLLVATLGVLVVTREDGVIAFFVGGWVFALLLLLLSIVHTFVMRRVDSDRSSISGLIGAHLGFGLGYLLSREIHISLGFAVFVALYGLLLGPTRQKQGRSPSPSSPPATPPDLEPPAR